MHDLGLDTTVAGLRCRDVLDDLSAYLDGELPGERVARLDAHLRDCPRCARFGGDMARLLAALRDAVPLPDVEPSLVAAVLGRVHATPSGG
ncbi:MAG: zf-HC2 domain-containing protein [Gemmatimonadetes bacterium]|nr:zf-HC2 domain-containing protein [Gemmatimonadota bacterium]